MHNFLCYIKLARIYIYGQVRQNKWGVVLYILGLGSSYLVSFFSIWIIMDKFTDIGGWSLGEVAFIYIICLLSAGLANIFFVQFRMISNMVQNGEIDRILLRPINPLISIMGLRFELNGLANILIGVLLLYFLRAQINIEWTLINIVLFIISIISASLIHGSITILIGCLSFKFIRTEGLDDLYSSFRDFVFYPITIYNTFIQLLLCTIIPLAFASYIPAGIFLNNQQYSIFPKWVWMCSPVYGFILFFITYRIWLKTLKNYQSTGS